MLVFFTFVFFVSVAFGQISNVGLTPDQMILNHGYPTEIHKITTDDGYIITVYRIPYGKNDTNETLARPAVLLVHGFVSCASEFVALGPEYALSYILADAGYDVWLLNARGTQLSKEHTTINVDTDPEKFYNFTWHEIGIYDVANAIDYILDLTEKESLYYVGHSQGTTTFLVLASVKPEYNKKIRLASLMAPAAILENYPNEVIRDIAKSVDEIWNLLQKYGIYEVPFLDLVRETMVTDCAYYPDLYINPVCDVVYEWFTPHVDKNFMPVIMTNEPSDAGVKQYVHYGQLVKDGGFRQFDYGTEINLQVYGSEVPPDYNLTAITAPLAIYYATNDGQIAVEDELTLVSMLPHVILNYLVRDDNFVHNDFGNSQTAVDLVYKKMLSIMEVY